jgi:lipid-A-disaccharide synthase
MTQNKKIFFIAGEASGDVHGQKILKALEQENSNTSLFGVGGPLMRSEDFSCFLEMEELQVMGFTDVLAALPKLYKSFKKIVNHILSGEFDAVVFIDFPGFNLRLAKALRKKGFKGKLIHFICPHVWVWRKHRIKSMAENLDLLMTIYPFEVELFAKTNLTVKYTGNPLFESVQQSLQSPASQTFPKHFVSIFPGSRKGEIERNLPIQLRAATLLAQSYSDLNFGLSISHPGFTPIIEDIIKKEFRVFSNKLTLFPQSDNYDAMKSSQIAIATSGTIILELALHQTPTVVGYKLTKLNSFLARYVFRIILKFYSIANIVLGKEIFPELIHNNMTPENLYEKSEQLLFGKERKNCLENCTKLTKVLECTTPAKYIATSILELL